MRKDFGHATRSGPGTDRQGVILSPTRYWWKTTSETRKDCIVTADRPGRQPSQLRSARWIQLCRAPKVGS